MTPGEFIAKWRASELKERSAAQEHFIDLCRLLGEPTPAEADPTGEHYCFERGARKDTGGDGWPDVWKRHCFAWEYKGKHANLDVAFNQLRQYALALENPPLLIVSDMARFRIRTNWTNSVCLTHEFTLEDLAAAGVRDKLKWAMSNPERLRPGESRQALTERAAATFAELAQSLRERGHEPQHVAHFVNRLVFCMFAEDVGLLPDNMFTRMLEHARKRSDEFTELSRDLFGAMASGGRIGFEAVASFNGGLFDDDETLPLVRGEIDVALKAAALDWSEIDPSIFGTLFERGLDPDKRSQLGAHYTDREKIMLIVQPVIIRPLLAEWETTKAEIGTTVERAGAAKSAAARTRLRQQAERSLRSFLERLRKFIVLDPACGSGNFLYMALHALKDIEHRVQLEAETMGLQRGFPAVGPANVKGIEINAYAAELARVSVWIGEIQWMRRNGFRESRDPILKPLDTIECRDAILGSDASEPQWPEANVIIGNPPFLGDRVMRDGLGHEYTERIRYVYRGSVPGASDLVCYWFHKAGELVTGDEVERAGLVSTNSIRGGNNRAVLDRIGEHSTIFDAWSDEPWVSAGRHVGEIERTPHTAMGPDHVITDRGTLRERPPDILLTNYKMHDDPKVIAFSDNVQDAAHRAGLFSARNAVLESELEARFIEALRRIRIDGETPGVRHDLVQGKPGYVPKVGDRTWFVEPQAELGDSDGVAVPSRPDFLIRPARATEAPPVAVFMDGFEYHRDSTDQDSVKRMALVRAGFLVWSLTWHDLEVAFGKAAEAVDFLEEEANGGAQASGSKTVATSKPPRTGELAELQRRLDERWDTGAIRTHLHDSALELLLRYLAEPVPERWKQAVFTALIGLFQQQRTESGEPRMLSRELRSRFDAAVEGSLPGQVREALDLLGGMLKMG